MSRQKLGELFPFLLHIGRQQTGKFASFLLTQPRYVLGQFVEWGGLLAFAVCKVKRDFKVSVPEVLASHEVQSHQSSLIVVVSHFSTN